MTKKDITKFLILRTIGNFLVLFAIFGVAATFGPTLFFEVQYRIDQAKGVHYVVASPNTITGAPQISTPTTGFQDVGANSSERILTPIDTSFDVLIPKIGANAKVYPNVDVSNEDEYLAVLKKGVAHAKGTVFPGLPGNIYLFAHSTDNFWDVGRYNAVFYLLKDVTPGDEIIVYFENIRHNYVVTSTKTVDPSDVNALVDAKTGKEQLVLQTCWPPGTTWKRILVFASPK